MKRIYGNWKMAQTHDGLKTFFETFDVSRNPQIEVGIFPSFVHLHECIQVSRRKNSSWILGGQDCSTEASGAYTGETSATSIAELGGTHVLIGHSERRQRQPETADSLRRKLEQALAAHLTPVFCVGETEAERAAGQVEQVLSLQLSVAQTISENLVIAYEPVWAIGTGRVATFDEIKSVHAFVHQRVPNMKGLLYGGSVKAENSREILQLPGVDGLLVGGASLKADSFKRIVESTV